MKDPRQPQTPAGDPGLERIPLEIDDPSAASSAESGLEEETGLELLDVDLSIEEALGEVPPISPPAPPHAAPTAANSTHTPPAPLSAVLRPEVTGTGRDDRIADGARAKPKARVQRAGRQAPVDSRLLEWCAVCGARHPAGRCPGELLCREPERHGWRITVETPQGRQTHGVLLAPSGDIWRARIMTYPRTLWTVPTAARTLKFLGQTPHEAERGARQFIEEHTRVRGHRVVEDDASISVQPGNDDDGESVRDGSTRRNLGSIHVRFGVEKADQHAVTADLSEGGVFLVTGKPLQPGTEIRMTIEMRGMTIPLTGVVRWRRDQATPGRPQGMGIQLQRTPAIYRDYVQTLA